MSIHNITDSALLVKKSRRTIQRYIASSKLTMVRDSLGNPQIDITELIRVFGAISKVSQNRIVKKSQDVAGKSSRKNKSINLTPGELEDIITRAVEKALNKAIPLLIEQNKIAPVTEPVPAITSMAPLASIGDKKTKTETKTKVKQPINGPLIAKKKEAKNGYAAAFGLPNVITEVIHLQIMKLHAEGLTSREIGREVSVSHASVQKTINVSS